MNGDRGFKKRTVALAVTFPLVMAPTMATPATAVVTVDKQKLQRVIKRGIAKQTGIKVTVKCPKPAWVKGKVFYCKVASKSGQTARVKVTLGSANKGNLRWKVVN